MTDKESATEPEISDDESGEFDFDQLNIDNLGDDEETEESDEFDSSLEDLEAELDAQERREKLPLRDKIYKVAAKPAYNKISKIYAILMAFVIVISTASFLVGTFPQYQHYGYSSPIFMLEAICTAIFTIDYVLRWVLTRKHRLRWALEFLNVVDIVSVIPFYFDLLFPEMGDLRFLVILRILRFFRVFRVFKLATQSSQFPVVTAALKSSGVGFIMALFSISLFCLWYSSAIYYAEISGSSYDKEENLLLYDDGTESPFQSIPHALWWSLVTLTTVGYGDMYPSTAAGKFVAGIALVNSVFVMAFPLTIILSHFSVEYGKFTIEKEKKKRLRLQKQFLKGKKKRKTIRKSLE